MPSDRWAKMQGLLDQALGMDQDARDSFLLERCGDDGQMYEDITQIVRADEMIDEDDFDFLEKTVEEATVLLNRSESPSRPYFGKYEILAKVGEGGFGSVYKGHDPVLKRTVAIKTCNSDDERFRQRFMREAEISAALQHPNITTVHDLGFETGIPFLVQEFLTGEDLSYKIKRREALATAVRLQYLLQIARGLQHAHKKGVLHRDVKPGNVRVLENGRVKILDFGIARLMEDQNPITTEGVAMGTIGYLAPEQLEGREIDRRADIFSFGVLAYELLTFVRPFQGQTIPQTTYQLLHRDPKPISDHWPECPATLERLIARCLKKKPVDRYGNFEAILNDLEPIVQAYDEPSGTVSPLLSTPRELKAIQHRRLWWVIPAALVLTVVTIGLLWPSPENARPHTADTVRTAPSSDSSLQATEAGTAASTPPPDTSENSTTEPPPASSNTPTEAQPTKETSEPKEDARQESPSTSEPAALTQDATPGPTTPPTAEDENLTPPEASAGALPAESEPNHDTTLADRSDLEDAPTHSPPPSREQAADRRSPVGESSPPGDLAAVKPPAPPVEADRDPELIGELVVKYPPRARRQRQEAEVIVRIQIDENGSPTDTHNTTCLCDDPSLGFEAAAIDAVKAASYRPGITAGRPAKKWAMIRVKFSF